MKCRMVCDVCLRIAECGLRVIAATRTRGPKPPHHATFSAPGLTRYAGHTLHHTSRTTRGTPPAVLIEPTRKNTPLS
jgi:hypothetical protein